MMHDGSICNCGMAWPILCKCTCKICLGRNIESIDNEERHKKMALLMRRLKNAGIDLDCLAELVWLAKARGIKDHIEEVVKQEFAKQALDASERKG